MKKWIFKTIDRDTPDFFPASVEEYLPEKHLARFVVEISEQLDLSSLKRAYSSGGSQAWPPSLMVPLLFYGYATGVFSSRKLEQSSYDSIAFRYICANHHPDHDSINSFRNRFREELKGLFVEILLIAQASGVLKLGKISLDGTKIKANASQHKALSYKRACELEAQLQEEVDQLLKQAEEADQEGAGPDYDIPEELERRESRLSVIAQAKAEIERRAQQRYEQEQAEYEEKQAKREAQRQAGKKPRGKELSPPQPGPRDKDQVNLTDEQSRIMPRSGGGFEQAYNAQAAVDVDSGLIITHHVTQATNDKQQIEPTLAQLQALEPTLGQADHLLSDAGYYSEANVEAVAKAGITPWIAQKRPRHNLSLEQRFSPDAPEPEGELSPLDQMRWRMQTQDGRALYGQRKTSIEPTFGTQKETLGFRQFLTRGLEAVSSEWNLICIGFNLKRLFVLMHP